MTDQGVVLTRSTLAANGIAGRVYLAVRAASPLGVSSAVLRGKPAFIGENTVAVENALYRLKQLGHITLNRQEHVYLVDDSCVVPVMRFPKPTRQALLAEIADCEGGLAVGILAALFGSSDSDVMSILARDISRGAMKRITMPASYGGGIGLVLNADAPAATVSSPAPAPTPSPAPETLLAVVPAAIGPALAAHKPAGGRGAFELLPTGQFSIGWGGGFQLVLPRDVTREMFRFLDHLGGLNTSASLSTEAAP